MMRHLFHKLGSFVAFGGLALVMIGAGGAIWAALLYANVRTTPQIPWALPALCVVLWLFWQYVGGRGWPRSTSARRKALLRANVVSREAFLWSSIAGGLAIGALASLWILMFRLIPMPPNPVLPDRFTSSPSLIAAIIVGASLLAPIVEESAVRGYLQTILERDFAPVRAVAMSAAVFAVAHLTQGVVLPKLLFYFLVGVAFGTLAFMNNSILPVIPVHVAADLAFFVFVWPHDATRNVIWTSGPDMWFFWHCGQMVVCGGGAVFAVRRLGRISKPGHDRNEGIRPAAPFASGAHMPHHIEPFVL